MATFRYFADVKSASYTSSKPLVVKVGAWSGFTVDGKSQRGRAVAYQNTLSVASNMSPDADGEIGFEIYGGSFPQTDGVYTYPVGGNVTNAINLYYFPSGSTESYKTIPSSAQLTLTRNKGKVSVKVENVTVQNLSGSSKMLSVDAREL